MTQFDFSISRFVVLGLMPFTLSFSFLCSLQTSFREKKYMPLHTFIPRNAWSTPVIGHDEDYEYSNYEIEELVSLWSNTVNGGQESDRKTSSSGTSSLWLYLASLVAVGSIAIWLILRMKNRTRKKNSSLDSDDNSDAKARKEPLVDRSSLRQSESDIVEDLSAVECHVTQKERRKSSRSSSKSKSKSRRLRGLRKKSDSKHKRPWMSFASIETRSDSKEPPSEQDRP